jgi:NADH dehydrogenase
VYVGDVVRAMIAALEDRDAAGKRYDLCGPRAYTLKEIVRFACAVTGRRRLVLGLPDSLATLQAWTMEHLPAALRLLTRDNLRSMSVDSVCAGPFPAVFGFSPSALEAVAPDYLAATTSRARYVQYRHNAGR